MKFINQMEPVFDIQETNAVYEYMKSGGWCTEYKKTREFERMLCDYTGAKHCWITANGTVSLSIALMAVGVGVGDEVICPDFTMVATPNSVELLGAKAVFVDIEKKTLCMDFEKMKEAVTSKTKAIMLVPLNGRHPANMQQWVEFCQSRGIHLIEDAAQALGSFCDGKHLGRFGEIGSFSFSSPKIITTGQGGALITDSDEIAYRIEKIRDFGREKAGADHYLCMGTNSKFTDLQAVVGIEQMKKLPARVERKKAMGKIYDSLLENIPGVELIPTNYQDTSPWFFDILCEKRESLVEYLKSRGIGTRISYPALHSEPVYGYNTLHFPVAEEVGKKELWLPSSMLVTDEQIEFICGCIKEFYSGGVL